MSFEQTFQDAYNAVVALLRDKFIDESQTIPQCNCLSTIFTSDASSGAHWSKLFGILSFEYERKTMCSYLKYPIQL